MKYASYLGLGETNGRASAKPYHLGPMVGAFFFDTRKNGQAMDQYQSPPLIEQTPEHAANQSELIARVIGGVLCMSIIAAHAVLFCWL